MHIQKKKLKRLGRILLSLLLFLVLTVPSVMPAQPASSQFTVSVKYGYNDIAMMGYNVPFYITITNNGSNFEGQVQVIVPDNNQNIMYGKDLSLAAGATKQVMITTMFSNSVRGVSVRIVNSKDKTVFTLDVSVNTTSSVSTMNIGILSDDFTALSYLSGVGLYTNSNYGSVESMIYEFGAEDFPEDGSALDMLDAILISNFSTDRLSSAQLTALESWLSNGGVLFLGTGSTYSKTVSGLKSSGILANVDTSSEITYETFNTSYGLNSADPELTGITVGSTYINYYSEFSQNFSTDVQQKTIDLITETLRSHIDELKTGVYNTYDWAELFFTENEDFCRDTFGDYYYGSIDDADWQDWGRDNMESELAYLLYETIEILCDDILTEANAAENPAQTEASYGYVSAEMADVKVNGAKVLAGDTESTDKAYALAKSYSYGNGTVVIASFDFTQNPLVSYSSRAVVARMLFKNYCGSLLDTKIQNYNYTVNNYYYTNSGNADNYTNFLNALNSASAPPILLYSIVLVAYLVLIFVSFKKLKKKGKGVWFWGTQALMAFAFALIIFLCGFATRLHSAELRTFKMTEVSAEGNTVTELASFVMPSAKKYNVSLSKTPEIELATESTTYYSYSYNSVADKSSSFDIGFNTRLDSKLVSINNTSALSSKEFLTSYVDSGNSGCITAELTGNAVGLTGGTVTNNFDFDLEYAFVVYCGKVYLLGTLKKGETRTIDSTTKNCQRYVVNYSSYSSYSYRSINPEISSYFHGGDSYGLKEMLIGTNTAGYRNAMLRYYAFTYYIDNEFAVYSDSSIWVGGFTADDGGSPLQTDGKYKENSYSFILQNVAE